MATAFDLPPFRLQSLSQVLEDLGHAIDLTPAQERLANTKYEEVGAWLVDGESRLLVGAEVKPQGSLALGTAIRPWKGEEFDADAIVVLTAAQSSTQPQVVRDVVGDRLRANPEYRDVLEPMRRCWRLTFPRAFHLDMTPSTFHVVEPPPAIQVPDKKFRCWTPSNPIGFGARFAARALLRPKWMLAKAMDARGGVEPLPISAGPRGILRRTVQFMKRHRDVAFSDEHISDLRPISVIITDLAAKSYEAAVRTRVFDNELDLVLAVIEGMPAFIEQFDVTGRRVFVVRNETVNGENFADKWNENPVLADAFFRWHGQLLQDLQALLSDRVLGADALATHLNKSFGGRTGTLAMDEGQKRLSAARARGELTVSGLAGLHAASVGVPVRTNTFFGSETG
jgi:hypothetical protein